MKAVARCLLALAVALPAVAFSQDGAYPSKPIRIVAPFGAGGGGDTSLRLLGAQLSRAVGQPVVVDNKPGANGVIGAMEVVRAAPDGYTLFYGSTTTLAANASLMKQLPYQTSRDFVPITRVGVFPFLLVVHPDVPATTLAQLIAHAKASSKPLSFASASHAGLMAGSAFARMAGIELLQVPYKTASAALTDVVGGQVAIMFVDVAAGLPMVKAGRLRSLGVTTGTRSTLLPEVPAIAEVLPGYEVVAWTAMAAPAGTPPAVVQRLHAALTKVLAQPDLHGEFAKVGLEVETSTPPQTAAFLLAETDKWAHRIKAAGISPE